MSLNKDIEFDDSNPTNPNDLKEEVRRLKNLLKSETAKNNKLVADLYQYQSLYERERRKFDKYNRELETDMEKRDRELEKREQEIFDLEEHRQRLLTRVDVLEGDIINLNQQNNSMAEKLCTAQKQLLEERNKSFPNTAANETALFDAEAKVEELKVTISNMKEDVGRLYNINFELDDHLKHLEAELAQATTDQESLRSLIKSQQSDVENYREQVHELQVQIHQLNSQIAGDMPVAAKGNSLFAEVIDGKDRVERELVLLHKQNRRLKKDYNRVSKIAYNNTMSTSIMRDRHNLQGPTLAVFKMTSNELQMRLEEKLRLLDKLHLLEEAERKGLMKHAKENPTEYNIFQENLNNMVLREKHRLERRVVNMELRERELLDSISFEKSRASSVPQLEYKLQQCEQLLANYEKAQLRFDDEEDDGIDVF